MEEGWKKERGTEEKKNIITYQITRIEFLPPVLFRQKSATS